MSDPLVSICCLTYNHEKYIKQCLEGFLMQETNFLFEILIHDDASIDGTADIIREYENKYPSIIKPIYQFQNQYSLGVRASFEFNFPRAKGKYIAICEGDDYWTDPLKLQKQVDFLENNLDYTFCTHQYKIYSEFDNRFEPLIRPLLYEKLKCPERGGVIIDKSSFHLDWFTQPLTSLFRRDQCDRLLKLQKHFSDFRDVHIFYLMLSKGFGFCIGFVGGVYRMNEGGIHASLGKNSRELKAMNIYGELYLFTKDKSFLKLFVKLALVSIKNNGNAIGIVKKFISQLSLADKTLFGLLCFPAGVQLLKTKFSSSIFKLAI